MEFLGRGGEYQQQGRELNGLTPCCYDESPPGWRAGQTSLSAERWLRLGWVLNPIFGLGWETFASRFTSWDVTEMKYIVESDEQKKRYAKFLEDVSPEMLSFIKAASKAFGTIKRIEHEYPAPRKRGVRDT